MSLPAGALIRFSAPIDQLGPKPWPLDISTDDGATWRGMTEDERAQYDETSNYMFTRPETQ